MSVTDPTPTQQLAQLQKQVLDLQLAAIRGDIADLEGRVSISVKNTSETNIDHEKRIRALEESATKVNTLIWLATGGGALSAINLFLLLRK